MKLKEIVNCIFRKKLSPERNFSDMNVTEIARVISSPGDAYTQDDKRQALSELSDSVREGIPYAYREVAVEHAKRSKQTPEQVAQMKLEGQMSLMAAEAHVFDMFNDPIECEKLNRKRQRKSYTAEELGLLRPCFLNPNDLRHARQKQPATRS